jgi:hypothetical protein
MESRTPRFCLSCGKSHDPHIDQCLSALPALAVGVVTADGHSVGLCCAGQLAGHEIAAPIIDPAPHGIHQPGENSDRYGAACHLCGWGITRSAT